MAWKGDVYPPTSKYKALFKTEEAYGVNLHVEATGPGCVVRGNTAAGAATIGLRLTGTDCFEGSYSSTGGNSAHSSPVGLFGMQPWDGVTITGRGQCVRFQDQTVHSCAVAAFRGAAMTGVIIC